MSHFAPAGRLRLRGSPRMLARQYRSHSHTYKLCRDSSVLRNLTNSGALGMRRELVWLRIDILT